MRIVMCIIKIGLSILQTVGLGGLVRLGLKLRTLPSISGGLLRLGPKLTTVLLTPLPALPTV